VKLIFLYKKYDYNELKCKRTIDDMLKNLTQAQKVEIKPVMLVLELLERI